MNACQKTQALLFEKADRRTSPATCATLEAHLAICPDCQATWAAWSSALPRLRELSPDEPSAVGLRRMENEVLRAVDTAAVPSARRWPWLALAAGLALLVSAGLLARHFAVPPPFARIQTTWGRVTLSGVAMAKGAAMGPGGVLEIAAEGEAALVVGREATVRLVGPGRLVFAGTAANPRLRLDSGRIAVQIAHRRADESFVVATAHGRVEVRGTRFVVGYRPGGSYVHVEEGEVAAFRQGGLAPFVVQAGSTLALEAEAVPEAEAPLVAPPSPVVPPSPAVPRACPSPSCGEATARARKAMRARNPTHAVEVVDEALAQAADCAPPARCLDELGYLRAEALRQAGRLEAAITAYQGLNRTGATRAMRQNALYAAAQLERRLGRAADARTSLERAYAAYPEGALAEESMAGLLDVLEPTRADARAAAEAYLRRYPQGMAAPRARHILSLGSRSP